MYYSSDSNINIELMKLNKKIKKSSKNSKFKITTEGLSKYSKEYFSLSYIQIKELYTCDICCKVYCKDMIVTNDTTKICFHCLVSLIEIDKDIELLHKYILKCHKDHYLINCSKEKCYLCDYNNNRPILNYKVIPLEFKIKL